MDWEQAQRLGQAISIAISESMKEGFSHMAEREDAREKARAEPITIRDFFAGCALIGIYANPNTDFNNANSAFLAFYQADAMMAKKVLNDGT